jgi:ABC-type multidrug transport system ATPase subunit
MNDHSNIILEAKDVSKSYNGTQVLAGVELQIRPSDFYVLMGPNGSGKSTLLSILAGTNTLDTGTVKILGYDISQDWIQAREHIGYVPQENFCSAFLTGRENLEYFAGLLELSGIQAKARIDELLIMVGLEEDADRRVAEYSGGMRKRLEVATALLGDAKILFLDESTAGLDPAVRKDFLRLLREINRRGTAILMVTHIGEDAEVASPVGFMLHGEIIAEGTPEELKERSGLKTSIIIDASPRSDELMMFLASLSDDCIVTEREETLVLTCENMKNIIPKIVDELQNSGFEMRSVTTRPPSLEDVFYHITEYPIRGEA